MKSPFIPANILLPQSIDSRWPVVACDQFTSQPEYWQEAEKVVGDAPSTLNMILPEVYLEDDPAARIEKINNTINSYLEQGIFREFEDSMVYVERTLPDGSIRRGLVGAIDLEAYDFAAKTEKPVRATEGTVLSRIPPRVEIRKDALVELPHVMLLADDADRTVIEPLTMQKDQMDKLYDVRLMMGGGRLEGYLLTEQGKKQVQTAIERLYEKCCKGFLFAVGDGNHSLATAKTCYEKSPNPNNRYALCELVNLHDESLEFEPIYRVMYGVDPDHVLSELKCYLEKTAGEESFRLEYYCGTACGSLESKLPSGALPVGILQDFIDTYVLENPLVKVDYIHGENVTKRLAKGKNTIGFVFPGMEKKELFSAVEYSGALPRKTFSMGEAASKRYYMECRRITAER